MKLFSARVGIVGSEAAKFTPETEAKAREAIKRLVLESGLVVSGGCHLGGIDIWAKEIAKAYGVPFKEYLPKTRSWTGYKARNLEIVDASDKLVCITVKALPEGYTGMRFKLCYHCGTDDHVKSGGCWTMKQAKKQGKDTELIII